LTPGTASDSEGIWAKLVKPLADKAIVEVDNIPFFTKSVSLRDKITVILAKRDVIFESVVERGGHSTYRIFLDRPSEDKAKTLERIKAKGCGWERTALNGGELYALDSRQRSIFTKSMQFSRTGGGTVLGSSKRDMSAIL
jgi:hypothetical protein